MRRKRGGFTLVEVLICMVILLLAATGVMSALEMFNKSSTETEDIARATLILEREINRMKIRGVAGLLDTAQGTDLAIPCGSTTAPLIDVTSEMFDINDAVALTGKTAFLTLQRLCPAGTDIQRFFARVTWTNRLLSGTTTRSQTVFSTFYL